MRPIILVPGIGGSILVDKTKPTRDILRKEVLHNRWLNIYPFIPKSIDQWKQDMGCNVQRGYSGHVVGIKPNNPNITTYDFGGTKGIKDVLPEFLLLPDRVQEMLQTSFHFRYFHDMCEEFYSHGYKDHETLFGIPYDFRLVLDMEYRNQLFAVVKQKIEMATTNTQRSCVVATHSLGGVMFKWFLSTYVDKAWIKKHIHKLYLLTPPFGGSLYSLKTVLFGDFYIPHFHHMYKPELQTNTGIIACLPNHFGFDIHHPLLEIEEPEYSVVRLRDYHNLYTQGHLSFQIWYDLYLPHLSDICSYIEVDCHVINAINKATPYVYRIKKKGEYPYKEYHSNGDGILLPLKETSTYHQMFPKNKLQVTTLQDCKHTDIISSQYVIKNILEHALN